MSKSSSFDQRIEMIRVSLLCLLSLFLSAGDLPTQNVWTEMVKKYNNNVIATAIEDDSYEYGFVNGSGFIIAENVIATAGHLAESILKKHKEKKKPFILLYNNKRLRIKKVYYIYNKKTCVDVGLIITEGMNIDKIPSLVLRRSYPEVGEEVLILGNPWEYRHAAFRGSVVLVGRPDDALKNEINSIYVQNTSYFGASGSPLMDINGEVLGILSRVIHTKRGYLSAQIIPIKYLDQLLVRYYRNLKK